MRLHLTLFAISLASTRAAESFSCFHENVLGTALELRVTASSEDAAKAAENSVLAEVDRLSAILSTWKKDSEIKRWQESGKPLTLSPDLTNVLKACEKWTADSQGAFSVRPSSPDSGKIAWTFSSASGSATYLAKPGEITIDALAKGYIIDRAVEKAAGPHVSRVMLNIGGDLRVSGDQEEIIRIADPRHDAENAPPLASVVLKNQSMATSGNYRRGKHLIDPRTRQPAEHIASASVIANDATTADALATIFNILKPVESLRLADSLTGVSCLIVSRDGELFSSRNWQSLPTPNIPVAADTPKEMELTVDFEINRPEAERYLRPYVVVWIADKDGKLVRTLSLWILKGNKGLKWLPRLKQWNRADAEFRVRGVTPDIPPISSATRNPGKYSVVWDGLDDQKKPLPAGDYTFYLEAVREHGTYQILKHPIKTGGEPFKATLEEGIEIKGVTLDYHPKAVAN
jgi:FAD:protein FMN transferase